MRRGSAGSVACRQFGRESGSNVDAETLWDELVRFEAEIARIEMRFARVTESFDALIRQYVGQVIDVLNDALGANEYSRQISADFNRGFRKYPPSVHCVRSIIWTIRAARRGIERSS